MSGIRSFAVIVMVGSLAAGCGDEGGESASSTSTTSGTPRAVSVERDIAYATAPEGWFPAVLDVYAPADAEDLPLVVLLHGGGLNKDTVETPLGAVDYARWGRTIAAGGAVVVVPNWGQLSLPWDRHFEGATTAQILDEMRQTGDEVACALSFAVSHAAEYGADPTRLVLFGHSAGANQAGSAAWTESSAFAGCGVAPADWTVQGLMLWEGDWLAGNPQWDVFRTDVAAILPLVSPWPSLATATDVPQVDAEFAVTTTARGWIRHPNASPTAEWLAWRDPTPRMQNELQAIDAFADGYLDIGEPSEVMVNTLNAHGVNASLVELTDPASDHNSLAEADFDLMVEHVLALAGT